MSDAKELLRSYLQNQREALVWKLDGLSDRAVREPLTRTGSNLLGIVKHVASVEQGYLVECVGREPVEPTPWFSAEAEVNADMWATADESTEWVVDFYRTCVGRGDATIAELPLDTVATVPWWPDERRHPTLERLVIHVLDETARHAGHADILRELIDGQAGVRRTGTNLPPDGSLVWPAYVEKLHAVARSFD